MSLWLLRSRAGFAAIFAATSEAIFGAMAFAVALSRPALTRFLTMSLWLMWCSTTSPTTWLGTAESRAASTPAVVTWTPLALRIRPISTMSLAAKGHVAGLAE